MRQTSDQLVNFRALAAEVASLKQELQKKDTILRGLVSDMGILSVKPDPVSTATPSSVNAVEVSVNFGSTFTHFAETVVTGLSWVALDSNIVVSPKYVSSDQGVEYALLSFHPVVHSIVAGDGFTLSVYTPIEAKGTYSFSCIGV